jgi:hypothetical protein
MNRHRSNAAGAGWQQWRAEPVLSTPAPWEDEAAGLAPEAARALVREAALALGTAGAGKVLRLRT